MARAWTFCADVMTLPLEPLEPLSSLDSRAGRHYYVWETVICDGMPVEVGSWAVGRDELVNG